MAVKVIEQFEPVPDTHTRYLIDSWYHCKWLCKAAQRRGWDISAGLRSNRKLRLISGDGARQWLNLAEYAATLGPED